MSLELSAAVERAQNGDTQAFAQLYSLVYKDLYRVALLNLNNEHDASDVVSDTVLEAYQKIRKLRDPAAFKAWITAILTAQINKKLREYVRKRNLEEDIEDLEGSLPDSDFQSEFGMIELQQAMQVLSEEERMVLTLSVVSGFTSEEISQTTGISANTVRSKIARAKAKLRKHL